MPHLPYRNMMTGGSLPAMVNDARRAPSALREHWKRNVYLAQALLAARGNMSRSKQGPAADSVQAEEHDLRRSLGPKIRRLYEPVVSERTPSAFLRLLRQLQHVKRRRRTDALAGTATASDPPRQDVLVAVSFRDNRVGYIRVPSATALLDEGSLCDFARKQQLVGLLGPGDIVAVEVTMEG